MKKNKMMRLASVLLVLTLLSTSVISGTFAKYVTQDSTADSARVAKWGVTAAIYGDLFGATYVDEANGNSITSYSQSGGTVSSDDGDFVVAPGTENKAGLTVKISGTPEVATKITVDDAEENGVDYENSDICLEAGTYGVMVPYAGTKTAQNYTKYFIKSGDNYVAATEASVSTDAAWFELHDVVDADQYYPLTWYVNNEAVVGQEKVLEALAKLAKDYNAPNADLKSSVVIGWAWNFGEEWADAPKDENTAETDKKDTILGNMMAAAEGANVKVVMQDGNTYYPVSYSKVAADPDNECANTIIVAEANSKQVACLTVALNVRVTIEQVD